jgi:2,4-dienoyl-CoA reductase (NADPH2)
MTGQARCPHAFSPLDLGHTRLKNRILMGSMQTGLEEVEHGFERMAACCAERARGGVGMRGDPGAKRAIDQASRLAAEV